MKLDLPFWFRQRQAKADELSRGSFKITGPNLPEGVVSIRIADDLTWRGHLQAKQDGPEIAATVPFAAASDALAAAIELYRTQMIV